MLNKCTKLSGLFFVIMSLSAHLFAQNPGVILKKQQVICGADRTDSYLPTLAGKRVGLIGNKSSQVGPVHLLDTLLRSGIEVVSVFCPEHGFRGEGEAGEKIDNYNDPLTGIPVKSLYGSNKKPEAEDLKGIDILVFDIQDVGARFYTYISTLHYAMEAAAENGIPLMIFDRPNPNGFYVDGPLRQPGFESFVGMHPVPVVHGMTIGEYGEMINGEKWLAKGILCDLEVISCDNYDHSTEYLLPVRPSPNLPNQISVYLYPSLCLFEGTIVSIGRGTIFPFQVYGHPEYHGSFCFSPEPIPGASMNPKWKNTLCQGVDLRETGQSLIFSNPVLQIEWLIDIYKDLDKPDNFFTSYFDTLAGSSSLREMIIEGQTAEEIRQSWSSELSEFRKIRQKYLLYAEN
ncbi:MAG: DUF1343 domain-containing protein [Bacteroidota bacterium]|nr:DUF1343 domain-containing protein [Bacteroidota bacterium]